MKGIAKNKCATVEFLYWDASTDINEAKDFFKNDNDWKVCEYFIEEDDLAHWVNPYCVNLMHEDETVPYKTYIVKTDYGIVTLNKFAFESLFTTYDTVTIGE